MAHSQATVMTVLVVVAAAILAQADEVTTKEGAATSCVTESKVHTYLVRENTRLKTALGALGGSFTQAGPPAPPLPAAKDTGKGKGTHTTWKGTAADGSKCTSNCYSGLPPSKHPLGFAATKWCFTDTKTSAPSATRRWGVSAGSITALYPAYLSYTPLVPARIRVFSQSSESLTVPFQRHTGMRRLSRRTLHPWSERPPGQQEGVVHPAPPQRMGGQDQASPQLPGRL